MEDNWIPDLPIRKRTETDKMLDDLMVEVHTGIEEMAQMTADVINESHDRAIARAVNAERIRIAGELYKAGSAWEISGDELEQKNANMMVVNEHWSRADILFYHANRLVYSVYPWQEWFDQGLIHGGE
jgi:hypothetical protein